jgi:succinate dehydrogenase flavin-adding protein (antitoxin of CptAB toxin-antitoxin module)
VGNFEVKKFTAMQKQNQKMLVNESSIHRHITQGILPFDAVLQAFLRSVITGESKNLIAEQKYVKLLPEMDFQLYKASAENSSSEIYCSRL